MKQQKRSGLGARLLQGSLILYGLRRFVGMLYDAAGRSLSGKLLGQSGEEEEKANTGVIHRFFHRLFSRVLLPFRHFMIRRLDHSAAAHILQNLADRLLYSTMRVYSNFFLCFGLYGAAIQVLAKFVLRHDNVTAWEIGTSVAIAVLALFLRQGKGSMAQNLAGSRIGSFVLFSVIGLRHERFDNVTRTETKSSHAIIAGSVLGLAAYFATPVRLLLYLFLALCAIAFWVMPECGAVAILFYAPFSSFLPDSALVCLVVYVAVCYLFKVFRCKRTFRCHAVDAAVLFLGALTLAGGFTSICADSAQTALMFTCFLFGYFPVANLITSGEWIRRATFALCTALLAVAAYGVFQYITGDASTQWQDTALFGNIAGRVVSTLDNPNILGEFLVLTIPAAFTAALIFPNRVLRTLAAVSAFLGCICLVFTWSRGAWLGFLIAMFLFCLLYSRRTAQLPLVALCAVPVLPFLLPDSIISRFMSIGNLADSSTSYRVSIWHASAQMAKDHFWSGLGFGTQTFAAVYPGYAAIGVEAARHSHNLYLQLMIEFGIVGPVALAAVVLFLTRRVISAARLPSDDARVRKYSALSIGLFCGVVGLLAQGMTDYVWFDHRIYLITWIVMGLAVACARVASAQAKRSADYLSDLLSQ